MKRRARYIVRSRGICQKAVLSIHNIRGQAEDLRVSSSAVASERNHASRQAESALAQLVIVCFGVRGQETKRR